MLRRRIGNLAAAGEGAGGTKNTTRQNAHPKPGWLIILLLLLLCTSCNLPSQVSQGRPELPRVPTPSPSPGPTAPAATATPTQPQPSPTAPPANPNPEVYSAYTAQSGDTLAVVAARFGTDPTQILTAQPAAEQGLLTPGQVLYVPRLQEPAPYDRFGLPDSEVINSPCGREFDSAAYINTAGGWLSDYTEEVDSQLLSGSEIVERAAQNASINPRLLLAFIEYRSHWVLGQPEQPNIKYPLGFTIPNQEGLSKELTIAANLLNIGYYAWREGRMTELTYLDGSTVRISPALNPGTAALQYLLARMFAQAAWWEQLYGTGGLLEVYRGLFGDDFTCARTVEPLFAAGVQAPALELPFAAGEAWALTGGLHTDWSSGTPLGALDFAPITGEPPCEVSRAWVRAPAAGLVTRSENGILQLALSDAAGNLTGWEVLLMHIAEHERLPVGTRVQTDDPLGHPSCEGGAATGTHVHITRLYRGEWIGAGEPFPFILSGWLALPGEKPYQSTMIRDGVQVQSDINGGSRSVITR